MLRAWLLGLLAACLLIHSAYPQAFFQGSLNNTPPSPTLSFTALANASTSSTTAGSGTYTTAALSGLTSATYGGGCSGSSTVSGFSASGGTWSATFTTPSSACTGTLTVTGTGSNTASATSPSTTFSSSGNVAFAVPTGHSIHFMAASGCSDSNNGTSTSTPWCTPNHALSCGDLILAQAGDYSGTGGFQNFGTVSTCPSTSGGIDGTGGVNFAIMLCAGSDLGTSGCKVDCSNTACNGGPAGGSVAFDFSTNHWAVEGWTCNGGGDSATCFQTDACANNSTQIHHIALINNISFNTGSGMATDECGLNEGASTPGTDYFYVIGNIVEDSAQNTICLAAIDVVSPSQFDATAGTHIYIYNNYAYHQTNSGGCGTAGGTDVESIMTDSVANHGYSATMVFANNISWQSCRFGIQILAGGTAATSTPTIKILNNTLFANNVCQSGNSFDGDMQIQLGTGSQAGVYSIQNNIVTTNRVTPVGGSNDLLASLEIGSSPGVSLGNWTVSGNWYKSKLSSCPGSTCDAGNNIAADAGSSWLGTNTYTDPGFQNTTDLLANWIGSPNCTGFITTTACMGYNANTQTTTSNTPIYDLTATTSGASAKGFQLPSTTCATNADYTSVLKGIVYLQASGWTNGATITENSDLVSKPCNL